MEKIDYGDINKFFASAGIVLIGLSILTPYFYLREDFGLYIELDKFNKFQEPVKNLILSKQHQVTDLQKLIPLISIGLLLIGLTSLIYGLRRWLKRQTILDEKFIKEVQKLNLEIVALTPAQNEEKVKKEVKEIEKSEQIQVAQQKVNQHNDYIKSYLKIEQSVADVFIKNKDKKFEILPQQRIGNRIDIDILIRAKSKNYFDRIVEIKYFKNRLPIQISSEIINRLNTQIDYYYLASNRSSIPVLLIVYNKVLITDEQILKFQKRLKDDSKYQPNLKELKIEFINEKEIEKFDVKKIINK